MSFIFDNHLQDDLDFLNDGKREEPLKKKKSNIDKKNIVNNNDTMENKHISDKVNQIKVLNVNHLQNKLNENCNGINKLKEYEERINSIQNNENFRNKENQDLIKNLNESVKNYKNELKEKESEIQILKEKINNFENSIFI